MNLTSLLWRALLAGTLALGGAAPALAVPAQAQSPATTYVCPMDPDVTANKPGVCRKCGMALVKVVKKAQAKNEVKKTHYVCPMDPEVVSDKPGVCRKCGMTLVKQPVKP